MRRIHYWGKAAIRHSTVGMFVVACHSSPAPKPVGPSALQPASSAVERIATCAPVRTTGDDTLIDDFESRARPSSRNAQSPFWFQYDDGTGGRLMQMREKDGGTLVLHATSSGFSDWGSGIGTAFLSTTSRHRACPYDASSYTGIRLRARGKGRVRMVLADLATIPSAEGGRCNRDPLACYDQPGTWIDLTEHWQAVELPLCTLYPDGWAGNRKGIDATELVNVQFRFGSGQDVEFWVDDLAFYAQGLGDPPARCGRRCPMDAMPQSARMAPAESTAQLTDELTLQTFEQSTPACGTVTRRYMTFVPRRLSRRKSVPVVMALHGSEGNAESMRDFLARGRFDQLATEDGFVVVYPNAAPSASSSKNPHFPNTGSWRQEFFDDGQIDDVAYLLSVIEDLKHRNVIDGNNPIYLVGISNGGGMVLKAARQHPERFRGIASVMGYDGEPPAAVPELRGTGLERVLFVYSEDDPGLPKNYRGQQTAVAQLWGKALGFSDAMLQAPSRTELENRVVEGAKYAGQGKVAVATRDSKGTRHDVSSSDGKAQLSMVIFDHAGHFWPHPGGETEAFAIERWGFRNQDVDAAELVWRFFSRRGEIAPSKPPSASKRR